MGQTPTPAVETPSGSKNRYPFQVISAFVLKLIALVSMLIDHTAVMFYETYWLYQQPADSPVYTWLDFARRIGRLAFPLFVFMLVEGMNKTHNRKKYMLRLFYIWIFFFLIGLVFSGIPGHRITSLWTGSAFTDLLCYALFIVFYERKDRKRWLCLLPVGFIVASYAFLVTKDYTSNAALNRYEFLASWYTLYGLIFFFICYFAHPLAEKIMAKKIAAQGLSLEDYRRMPSYQGVVDILIAVGMILLTGFGCLFGALVPSYLDTVFMLGTQWCAVFVIIPILLYNGSLGYHAKWFHWSEYLFYPIHLLILGFLVYFLNSL